MKKIALSKLNELFAAIAKDTELHLPVNFKGETVFKKWTEGDNYAKDSLKTVKSPKDLFFPQNENISNFRKEGNKFIIDPVELPKSGIVVFGVRGCDEQSFRVLDNVFLAEPVDTFYEARRKDSVIITAACTKPSESCFCKTFGIDPTDPAGDVTTWIVDDNMFFAAKTEKGEAFLAKYAGIFTEAEEDDTYRVENVKYLANQIFAKLPLADLTTEGWGGDKTEEKFDDPKWQDLSTACLGCGTCTFVCPTCQCYDIRDYNTGNQIQRSRCWDSCMYKDFTMCAHGTARPTQKERYRQRFMHKLVYYPANNDGMFSCVGCGRCVDKCPVQTNIVKVIKAFGGDKK